MKRMLFALLFFALAFTAMANAQRFGSSTCGLIPGPCMERAARQAYAPADYMINNYGYGGYYGNGRIGTNAIVGGVAGAITGGLVARAVSHNNQTVYATTAPSGGQSGGQYYTDQRREVVFSAPKSQKPLDCRKPRGKRGKNEAACAIAETEAVERQQVGERQVCLDQLANSTWRLRNGSDRFPFHPTVDNRPMTICGESVVLRPLQTIRIFPPDGQIGGKSFGAGASGGRVELTAKVRPVNQPGFIGFILMAPGAPEGGN